METLPSAHYEPVTQRESIGLRHLLVILHGIGILDAAEHVHTRHGGGFCQPSGLKNEVFNSRVVRIGINAGPVDFPVDGQCAVAFHVQNTGNIQYIILAQRDVRRCPGHDTFDVHRHGFHRQVFLLTMHHGTLHKRILTKPVRSLNQLANGLDAAVHLVLARMEHSPAHFRHVGEARNNGIHIEGVAVLQQETVHFKFSHRVDGILAPAFPDDPYVVRIGISGEAARVAQNGGHALALLHLIIHRALHLALYVDQAVVRADHNHVVILQTDIALGVPVQDVVIHVYRGNHPAAAIHLDVAQRTDVVDASGRIQSIKSRGQRTQRIRAGHDHFAHDLHLHGAYFAHRQQDVGVLEITPHLLFQVVVGLLHRKSGQRKEADILDGHVSVGRDGLFIRLLRRAPHFDGHFVSRAQPVVCRSGNVQAWLKSQPFIIKNITAENLAPVFVFSKIKIHETVPAVQLPTASPLVVAVQHTTA